MQLPSRQSTARGPASCHWRGSPEEICRTDKGNSCTPGAKSCSPWPSSSGSMIRGSDGTKSATESSSETRLRKDHCGPPTGTPEPGPEVSGHRPRCAAIRCVAASIRQCTPTCAMVRARSTAQAVGRIPDEEELWPSGRRPARDLGSQDLPGRRVARCAVSRPHRVVVRLLKDTRRGGLEDAMSTVSWLVIGLAAWVVVSVPLALFLGRMLSLRDHPPPAADDQLSSSGIDDRDAMDRRWSRRASAKSSDPEAEQGEGRG